MRRVIHWATIKPIDKGFGRQTFALAIPDPLCLARCPAGVGISKDYAISSAWLAPASSFVSFPIDRNFIRTPSSMIWVITRERGPWRAESIFSGSARSRGRRAEKVVVVSGSVVVMRYCLSRIWCRPQIQYYMKSSTHGLVSTRGLRLNLAPKCRFSLSIIHCQNSKALSKFTVIIP